MTRLTQISAAALLAVFASTAFVSTATSAPKKVWCKETSSKLFKTACEDRKLRKQRGTYQPTAGRGNRVQNFRGRSDKELGDRSLNGGNSNGTGGKGGRP